MFKKREVFVTTYTGFKKCKIPNYPYLNCTFNNTLLL